MSSAEPWLHKTAMRINRRIARPLVGRFVGADAYAAIRNGFDAAAPEQAALIVPMGDSRAGTILARHGVVVLERAVDAALADAARQEADALTARLHAALAGPGDQGVVDDIIWQVGGARFSNHAAIDAQDRPVANLRSRDHASMNGGVIDIFAIDKAARENGWPALTACADFLCGGAIADLIKAVSSARPKRINLLRNDGVVHTRGLHVDNLVGSYKAFLYLGDALQLSDGPYAYVPGSHGRRDLLLRQARLNSLSGRADSDAPAFEGLEMPLPVAKGSVIVSCQSGVHRGLPQRADATRTVLVASYWP